MRKLRIGIIGLVHDHVWNNLEKIMQIVNVEVTSAADLNKALLKRVRAKGVNNTYEDYRELLVKENVDAVLVYTENARKAEVTEAAAELGVHVMVEKPMAATLSQASRMHEISERNGIRLMINFPTTWNPRLRQAGRLAKQGAIGHIYEFWQRTGHKGPKEMGCSKYFYRWLYKAELNGAGAYMDFCCYGANHSRWILGCPEKATAIGGTYVRDYLEVDDNSCLLLGYKKAMAILRGTWSSVGEDGPLGPNMVFRGDEGIIAVGREVHLYTEEKGKWAVIPTSQLQEGYLNGPEHFIKFILEEKPFIDTASAPLNLEVQAILEAGLISMRKNRTVFLNELI